MGCINKVFLCGLIGRNGVVVHYNQAGTPCAAFVLVLSEQGHDGKVHTLFQDCEVWGKKAEAAGELEAGQLALFAGKLARRKKGESWETLVAGFAVTPVVPPVAAMTGSSNERSLAHGPRPAPSAPTGWADARLDRDLR
jgi:single-stranded DNA-binding protein